MKLAAGDLCDRANNFCHKGDRVRSNMCFDKGFYIESVLTEI